MKNEILAKINSTLEKYKPFIYKGYCDYLHEGIIGGLNLERGEITHVIISFVPVYGFPVVGDLTLSPEDFTDETRLKKLIKYLDAVKSIMTSRE